MVRRTRSGEGEPVDVHITGTEVAGGAGDASAANQLLEIADLDAILAVLGVPTGAAITTDADGTVQRYLRGLIKLLITAGAAQINANAGTNLNTSALALESGGNLAALAASASVLDDWDETDRAKVNLIAGQVAITGAAGAVAANTPRVTLASDDPAVAVLGTTSGAKVITDANGTIQQYLRGIIYQLITAGASFMTLAPATSGGLLTAQMTGADGSSILTNAAQAIKASAGQLFGWYIYNPNTSAVYIPIYNVAAASVTVGTTNPQMTLTIPASSAANVLGETGIQFTNAGFSAAAATTAGGNSAPASGIEANFFYK